MSNVTTASYKIGRNKGRPRIWLDGKRLVEAEFTGGVQYTCIVRRGSLRCYRMGVSVVDFDDTVLSTQSRKVTGRPNGKPIIDLLGETVEQAFLRDDHTLPERVVATFDKGIITITVDNANQEPST